MAYPSLAVSVVIAEAQVYLNDIAGSIYTSATLLPLVRSAWDDLQNRLIKIGRLPSIKAIASPVTVTALLTEYPAASVPADFLEPLKLEERTVGSSEDYIPMIETKWEPNQQMGPLLDYWVWRDDVIKLRGATTDRSVRLSYSKSLKVIVNETTTLPITYAQSFLSFRVAALASLYIGVNENRAQALNEDAKEALEEVVGIQVSHMQNMRFRRRPYGYRRAMRRMI